MGTRSGTVKRAQVRGAAAGLHPTDSSRLPSRSPVPSRASAGASPWHFLRRQRRAGLASCVRARGAGTRGCLGQARRTWDSVAPTGPGASQMPRGERRGRALAVESAPSFPKHGGAQQRAGSGPRQAFKSTLGRIRLFPKFCYPEIENGETQVCWHLPSPRPTSN